MSGLLSEAERASLFARLESGTMRIADIHRMRWHIEALEERLAAAERVVDCVRPLLDMRLNLTYDPVQLQHAVDQFNAATEGA